MASRQESHNMHPGFSSSSSNYNATCHGDGRMATESMPVGDDKKETREAMEIESTHHWNHPALVLDKICTWLSDARCISWSKM